MQDVGTGTWTEAGRVQGDTQCGIPDLELGHKYNFRVCCNNAVGQSDPLTNDAAILARDPWGMSSFSDFVRYFLHTNQRALISTFSKRPRSYAL